MGSIASKTSDEEMTQLFARLSGKEAVPLTDNEFWSSLLCFTVTLPRDKDEDQMTFEQVKSLLIKFCSNNVKSANFASLLFKFVDRVAFLTDESVSISTNDKNTLYQELYNLLCIIRIFLQYLIQRIPEHEIIKHLDMKGVPENLKSDEALSMPVLLCNKLFDVLIKIPLSDVTYGLHSEAINILFIFLSSLLFTTLSPSELEMYKIIHGNKDAPLLCKVLLQRFIQQPPMPKYHRGSILIGIASDLIELFGLSGNQEPSPMAMQSLLLCVVLLNHRASKENGCKDSLFSLSDNFDGLYKTICCHLHRKETTLLLYHLVHKNQNFRTFILSRNDIHAMVIPILKTIYNASSESCPHMYLSLIILLILTDSYSFNKDVHTLTVRNVSWYTERNLTEISLGGLIILVTTRAVQYNLLKVRDEYIHTNCLAALANMSSQFSNLHPYVCQRLVGLFETLAKTYNMAREELVTMERALRIILEVINSCLSNQLVHNPNLVYSLLYKKDVFEAFEGHPVFQDIIQNIEQVLQYFIGMIDKNNDSLDVESVLGIIEKYSSQLPLYRLQKFPELKFKYVEEENSDDFFIPYIWSLIGKNTYVSWLPSCNS